MSYVIGIDGGTESLRADIFDLSGRCVASVKTPYETHFPSPGHAEQTPTSGGNKLLTDCAAQPNSQISLATSPRIGQRNERKVFRVYTLLIQ